MNRVIKFRAWIKDSEVMIDQSDFQDFAMVSNGDGFGVIDKAEGNDWLPEDRFVLMQFTGLHDKSGKEIYEDDVVKTNYGKIGRVVYHVERAAFIIHDPNHFNEMLYQGEVEVIGNIYENETILK